MPMAVAAAASMRVEPRSLAPVCFDLGRRPMRTPRLAAPLQLRERHAGALAQLVPLLLCGEESAALAFGAGGARDALAVPARAELERIRREEVVHGLLLQRLQTGLPHAPLAAPLRARMRRFFVTLADPEPGRYFARIAGLDSAVCLLLGALRSRRSPLVGDPTLARTLASIHRDEAGHVDAARRIALEYAPAALATEIATETRRQLVSLLQERGAALETLGVDADELFARLGVLSPGIFR
jgi:hypothetical protein